MTPFTCSGWSGAVVPIPTLPSPVIAILVVDDPLLFLTWKPILCSLLEPTRTAYIPAPGLLFEPNDIADPVFKFVLVLRKW